MVDLGGGKWKGDLTERERWETKWDQEREGANVFNLLGGMRRTKTKAKINSTPHSLHSHMHLLSLSTIHTTPTPNTHLTH